MLSKGLFSFLVVISVSFLYYYFQQTNNNTNNNNNAMKTAKQYMKHALFRTSYQGVETLHDMKTMGSFYALKAKGLDGKEVDFKEFDNKVALVVNVASEWGETDSSYKRLVEMFDKLNDQGFVVLGFPCNQFGGQEPLAEPEIKKFADSYNVKFPLFSKIEVNGPNEHPVYTFLKQCFPGDITWNFSSKFIVNRQGVPVARMEKEPWPDIEAEVREYLNKK